MLRIGHRGAAGHAPENTILSIEKALAFGVDVVEIDLHRSRDGHLIVMHDARVDRTTNGIGYIRDLTLDQLRALRPAVPTLEEVLEAVEGKSALMIEMKVRGVADQVSAVSAGRDVYYASFLHSELLRIRELQPHARTIALIDGIPVTHTAFAAEANATHAGIGFDSLEPDFVRSLHAAGIKIFTWTVDDPRDIAYAESLQVDGIISNYPDRLPGRNSAATASKALT
jgi:glycerophosphoryl diester phosphodiesterase